MKSKVYCFKADFNECLPSVVSNLLDKLKLPGHPNRIAIKLNLCDFRRRETGAVSDPFVVDALLRSLRERYSSTEILLVENDATTALADILFKYVGIDEVAKKYDAKCVNLVHEKWTPKTIEGYHLKRIQVPKILMDADLLITHPKLKTIGLTKITCGLKNMFGCMRRKNKQIYHKHIDEVIVDINLALRSTCSIVDALLCHEGIWGPAYGVPKKVGLLIGGNDVVAVDSFCSKLAGFNPLFVSHIRKASCKGLGRLSFDVKGDSIDLKKYKFEFNRWLYYGFKLLRSRYESG